MSEIPRSRAEAQREADRLRIFREELVRLEQQGVLSLDTAQREAVQTHADRTLHALAAAFDIDATESQKRLSWGLRITSTLGGLALCAALVLAFARVWGLLDTPSQLAIGMLAPLLALAATEFAARRERTLYFAGLLALVSLAAFVLNLSLIGTVFNIHSTENALAAWGIFALLLAYRYALRLLLLAALGLLSTWTSAFFVARIGHPWDMFFERPENFLLAGAVSFCVPLALRHIRHADFPAVYRTTGAFVFFLAALFLSEGGRSYLFVERDVQKVVYGIGGLLASGGLVAWGIRRAWNGVVYVSTGFFVVFLYLRLHHLLWDWMPKYLFFALIGGIALVLVSVFKHIRGRLEAAQ